MCTGEQVCGGAWLTTFLARNPGISPVAWSLGVVPRAAARPLGPGRRGPALFCQVLHMALMRAQA